MNSHSELDQHQDAKLVEAYKRFDLWQEKTNELTAANKVGYRFTSSLTNIAEKEIKNQNFSKRPTDSTLFDRKINRMEKRIKQKMKYDAQAQNHHILQMKYPLKNPTDIQIELMKGNYTLKKMHETENNKLFNTMSCLPGAFFLYKKRDFQKKDPFKPDYSIKKQKRLLANVLTSVIVDDLKTDTAVITFGQKPQTSSPPRQSMQQSPQPTSRQQSQQPSPEKLVLILKQNSKSSATDMKNKMSFEKSRTVVPQFSETNLPLSKQKTHFVSTSEQVNITQQEKIKRFRTIDYSFVQEQHSIFTSPKIAKSQSKIKSIQDIQSQKPEIVKQKRPLLNVRSPQEQKIKDSLEKDLETIKKLYRSQDSKYKAQGQFYLDQFVKQSIENLQSQKIFEMVGHFTESALNKITPLTKPINFKLSSPIPSSLKPPLPKIKRQSDKFRQNILKLKQSKSQQFINPKLLSQIQTLDEKSTELSTIKQACIRQNTHSLHEMRTILTEVESHNNRNKLLDNFQTVYEQISHIASHEVEKELQMRLTFENEQKLQSGDLIESFKAQQRGKVSLQEGKLKLKFEKEIALQNKQILKKNMARIKSRSEFIQNLK